MSTPLLWPLAAAAVAPALPLGRAARGREQDERDTLAALAEAVLAGLVTAGNGDLAGAAIAVERDPAG